MRIKLALTLSFERARKESQGEEQFEHRDMDTAIEATTPLASVLRVGFTPESPEDHR